MPPLEKDAVVREWLQKASLDLEAAEQLISSQPKFAEIAAFHAQQGAEKSLKAFLIYHDVLFRKIHDMRQIGKLILKLAPDLKPTIESAYMLNPLAVNIRYPGEDEPVTMNQAAQHLKIAKAVYDEVVKKLRLGP